MVSKHNDTRVRTLDRPCSESRALSAVNVLGDQNLREIRAFTYRIYIVHSLLFVCLYLFSCLYSLKVQGEYSENTPQPSG